MYCEFYQLTERPFNVTPDPKFLYLNARYREAIASLNYGITQRKGFITLIGEAGTG
jgi:general secretion pathway protein A